MLWQINAFHRSSPDVHVPNEQLPPSLIFCPKLLPQCDTLISGGREEQGNSPAFKQHKRTTGRCCKRTEKKLSFLHKLIHFCYCWEPREHDVYWARQQQKKTNTIVPLIMRHNRQLQKHSNARGMISCRTTKPLTSLCKNAIFQLQKHPSLKPGFNIVNPTREHTSHTG